MTTEVSRDALGVVVESDDGDLRWRVTSCCGTTPRIAYRDGAAVVLCRGCGRDLPEDVLAPVPQRPGAPCTCIAMPPGWPIVPGRSTCGQHGDHVGGAS